jgi:hypothetical protein
MLTIFMSFPCSKSASLHLPVPFLISSLQTFIHTLFMHFAHTFAHSWHLLMRRCSRLRVMHVHTSLLNPMCREGVGW